MKSTRGPSWLLILGGPLAAALIILAGYVFVTDGLPKPGSKAAAPTPPSPALAAQPASQSPPAPKRFVAQIEALGKSFDGEVGIAVQSIEDGWLAQFNGTRPFPQQSVSKLWVATTIMNRVDRGELAPSDTITLTQNDLTIFHQPVRKKILATGAWAAPISELLFFAMTQSDNTANEALFRHVGGKAGIESFLQRNGLPGIAMAQDEISLQMSIAGTQWNPAFSYGRTFWTARNAIPWEKRKAAIEAYLRSPPDGATPIAVAQGLAMLRRGKLLSPQSTAYLLDLMAQSKTGPDRLKSGLSPGWTMAHKTGTGQVLQMPYNEHAGLFTAYNDVGILTSPSGKNYALVVMIGRTMGSVPTRQALMREVTQSVIACETSGWSNC